MRAVVRCLSLMASSAAVCALALHGCGSSPALVERSQSASSAAGPADPGVAPEVARADDDDDQEQPKIQIRTLSNRADLVSGGDALVEIVLSKPKLANALRVQLNGRDVTGGFAVRAGGRILGLVNGLANGDNVLVASTSKSHAARLVITNHPIGGPVIAGPQTSPFVCATPTPQASTIAIATNASGLHTNAIDAQCNIATETFLFYRTTSPTCVNVLPDPSPPAVANPNACFKPFTQGTTPADLAFTTTDQGVTVPYIVRVERGTIDRGIFDIAVLFTPEKPWTPFAPQPQ
ncbi:MAG: DUF6351 family protein, partial [Myxococcales bacterium]